jgi:small subunit ribosomal protein S1
VTETEISNTVIEPFIFFEEDEDFDEFYEESLLGVKEQDIVNGTVTDTTKEWVTIDIGFKSDCLVPTTEFLNEEGVVAADIGEIFEVFVEALEDDDGVTIVSKRKAEKMRTWEKVGEIFEQEGTVNGTIIARVKGGMQVDIGVKAFLPGSQVDLRPVRNLDQLLGEAFEFKILKYNRKRGNIVLSRRVLLEAEREEKRKETLKVLKEGSLIVGSVKNITDYGVFVDLGGVDGLLHITDMTWGRIVHPSEMFNISDEVEVVILKYYPEEQKVSLGYKQKFTNPWDQVADKYEPGSKITGKIVSLTDYGAFIELEPGVEGLIHVSEMSWTKKVRHPSKIVQLGQEVEAIVKDLDVERKRISLSMKEAEPNPWRLALDRYPVGSIVMGRVRNITDFGVFIGLDEGIDGLVHISDISWSQRLCKPSEVAKKGEEIEVKVLNIDVSQERLSLGVKQLIGDPWKDLDEKYPIRSEVTGTIVNITDFGIFVEVEEGVEGLVHISEVDSSIPKAKIPEFYPVNTEVHARVIKVDLEERRLGLSILGVVAVESPLEDSEQDAEATPETEETPAETETAQAVEVEAAPEVEEAAPEVEAAEVAPEVEETAPEAEAAEAALEVEETAPEAEAAEAALEVEETAPEAEATEAAPEAKEEKPKKKKATPKKVAPKKTASKKTTSKAKKADDEQPAGSSEE